MQQTGPSERSLDLVILNRGHGVLVGMGVKPKGPIMHTNHGTGPGLNRNVPFHKFLKQIPLNLRV